MFEHLILEPTELTAVFKESFVYVSLVTGRILKLLLHGDTRVEEDGAFNATGACKAYNPLQNKVYKVERQQVRWRLASLVVLYSCLRLNFISKLGVKFVGQRIMVKVEGLTKEKWAYKLYKTF